MIKRATITIFGEVQGVFFRVNTHDRAQELDLTGWVKNEANETVKILAEGQQEQLVKLIDHCQSGHKLAKVQRVEVKWEEATGEFKDFDIIHN